MGGGEGAAAAAAAAAAAVAPEPTYLTLIIDEAHLIRNQFAYWSLMAIAMGAEAQRVIPATGALAFI